MNQSNLALGYIRAAHNDYIAARVLLNRDYTLQGVILASTAIEKYFKALIAAKTGKPQRIHFDKLESMKQSIEGIGYGALIELIDPLFLEILSKAYRFRYYDNVKDAVTIGFFKNQFLGELDGVVALCNRLLIISNDDGELVDSPVLRAYKQRDTDLIENNWVALKIDKKVFMEKDCVAFGVYLHPDHLFDELNVSSIKMTIPYQGSMMLINFKNESK